MRKNTNNLTVLRNRATSRTATRATRSRVVTTLVAVAGLVAVALLASRSVASEKLAAATDARPEQLATLVAENQVAARRAIEASKKLTAAHDEGGEVVMASARIPAAGELLKTLSKAPKVHTIKMVVTAYCPCTKCCGKNAQGITASGKRVSHNNGRFVAADTKILPFGKKLVIPGYHEGTPVEVLDTGSAIKGKRLDVYFPSHQKALEWGKRSLDVTVMD